MALGPFPMSTALSIKISSSFGAELATDSEDCAFSWCLKVHRARLKGIIGVPIRNVVHVTCMLHAFRMRMHAYSLQLFACHYSSLHACCMHVSCNMHGVGMFSVIASCM